MQQGADSLRISDMVVQLHCCAQTYPETITPMSSIDSTHRQKRILNCTCGRRFRHGPYAGRLLEDAVEGLITQKLHPERDAWLTLDVIEKEGRLISIDNRRLWCLHEFHLKV